MGKSAGRRAERRLFCEQAPVRAGHEEIDGVPPCKLDQSGGRSPPAQQHVRLNGKRFVLNPVAKSLRQIFLVASGNFGDMNGRQFRVEGARHWELVRTAGSETRSSA
jgi:hypothetical protein